MSDQNKNQIIDIQHDDEFEDFGKKCNNKPTEQKKRSDWMDDWDDDVVENFSTILKEQRKIVQ